MGAGVRWQADAGAGQSAEDRPMEKGAPKTSGGFPKEEMPRLEVKKPSEMDWVVYKK